MEEEKHLPEKHGARPSVVIVLFRGKRGTGDDLGISDAQAAIQDT